MTSEWKSVRKVRSLAQIIALMEAVETGRGELEAIRKSLVRERLLREESKMRGAHAGSRGLSRIRRGFSALVKDNISFLKKIGLVITQDHEIVLTHEAKEIFELWRAGKSDEVRCRIIRRILMSPYRSYVMFLKTLSKHAGSITIPSGGRLRSPKSPLAVRLDQLAFKTDIWSFFTIRDLFYDLGLTNTASDAVGKQERIFLTSVMGPTKVRGFKQRVALDGSSISFDRVPSEHEFKDAFLAAYETETHHRVQWVSVLKLRDCVAWQLRISDLVFNSVFINVVRKGGWKSYSLKASAGYPITEEKTAYGGQFKSMNLPTMPSGLLVRYVVVESI